MLIRLLLRIGLIRRLENGTIRWPFYVGPVWLWRMLLTHPVSMWKLTNGFYIFRNPPGYIKWIDGRMLPCRWGFGLMGLIEFGDRG